MISVQTYFQILFSFILLLGSSECLGQIELIRTFDVPKKERNLETFAVGQDVGLAQLEDLGEKMYFFNFNNFSIEFYNEDSTLYKHIDIQFKLDPMFFWDIPVEKAEIIGASQYLFDSDEGIEFLVYLHYTPQAFTQSFNSRSNNVKKTLSDERRLKAILWRLGRDEERHQRERRHRVLKNKEYLFEERLDERTRIIRHFPDDEYLVHTLRDLGMVKYESKELIINHKFQKELIDFISYLKLI